jgi:hypothetical protein
MRKTTADQHPSGALRVSRIPPEQKSGFLRCFAYLLNTNREKPDRLPSCKLPSLQKYEHSQSNPLRDTPFQRAVELRRRSLIFSRCTPEPPLAEMVLLRGAPAVYFHHAGANCSVGNPPPRGNPGLKNTWKDSILKKFD